MYVDAQYLKPYYYNAPSDSQGYSAIQYNTVLDSTDSTLPLIVKLLFT